MDTAPGELGVLLWIVVSALVAVLATVIALVRSGRSVSLPTLSRRAPRRR